MWVAYQWRLSDHQVSSTQHSTSTYERLLASSARYHLRPTTPFLFLFAFRMKLAIHERAVVYLVDEVVFPPPPPQTQY